MKLVIPEFLDKTIRDADIVVFEGFEMTGKSTLAKEVNLRYAPSYLYRPNWEEVLTTDVVSRGNRHIPGISIVDSWNDMISDGIIDRKTKLLMDRWMAVSLVYQDMYQQSSDAISIDKLAEAFIASVRDLNLVFIHKAHASIDEAKEIYEISRRSSNDHNDIYDKFKDFNDYYNCYLKFEECYDRFYKSSRNPYPAYRVSSLTNEIIDGGVTNESRIIY